MILTNINIKMKQLHPRAVWLFWFGNFTLLFFLSIFLSPFLYSIVQVLSAFLRGGVEVETGVLSLEYQSKFEVSTFFSDLFGTWLIIVILLFIVTYVWARLQYHYYRFELREEVFYKEYGVIYKRNVSISYNRIQNIDIYRGIFDRLLGLSRIEIQTAGFSGYGKGGYSAAEGRLPGLSKEDARLIQEELIQRAYQDKESQTGPL